MKVGSSSCISRLTRAGCMQPSTKSSARLALWNPSAGTHPWRLLDQTRLMAKANFLRRNYRLGSVRDTELLENRCDVVLDGLLLNAEFPGDRLVREPDAELLQHHQLSR